MAIVVKLLKLENVYTFMTKILLLSFKNNSGILERHT